MKNIILALAILLFSHTYYAQSVDETILAFRESYEAEIDSNYILAIQKLLDVYEDSSYELNLRLGWLHYLNQDYSKSSDHYQKSMKLLPYALEAKLGFVLPLAAMGNWSTVINAYKEILKIDPQNTLVNYRMGAIYYDRKDYAKAFKHLEKVVNLYPFDYDSVVLLAWTNYRLGKLREAKVLFEKALMIIPEDSSALAGMGLIKQ